MISASVASIAFQWKMVKHYNSIAKGWGQGVLNLPKISNEALHGVTHNPVGNSAIGMQSMQVYTNIVYFSIINSTHCLEKLYI